MDITVIGLGLMGGTFVGHLLDQGHTVTGYDPDPDRLVEHSAQGGIGADSPGAAASRGDLVLLSLPNSSIMLDVVAEIAREGRAGSLVLDTTTGEPDRATQAAELLAGGGIEFIDCTVSGNAAQTAEKDIIFMIGGTDDQVARARSILEPMSRRVHHVGPVGAGATAKIVVNHILSINRVAVAEGLTVAEKAGLELGPMLEVLRDSAAYSKAMDIWGDRMVAGDHYPPASRVRQSHKDSRLINSFAEDLGVAHELTEVVRRFLIEAEESGLSDADNSSVMEVMRRRAGIGRLPRH
ncbi:MAG: NAD(P)-dependent oxidoreductase [Acidimicrobiia bacterium]|nr:NAD(P)-dependent oxidoreductase [Acidimicrobiia bacterium]